ncbi:MAG: hypothetical protein KGD61_11665 [Candidatus Lokiarchaeota archaeon]|nr:hypothetical protein [Candidatus Lokiarchaeota archaeon]
MIKIGLGKALGFSLLAFIGLNFLFIIIAYTIGGDLNTLFSTISSDPLIILLVFFGPIINLPGTVITDIFNGISLGSFDALLIQNIGFLVSPFVASLVAGRTGDGKGGSFGGWMIAALIGSVALGVLAFVYPSTLLYYGITVINPIISLIVFMLNGVVNGIFYGCFALLFSKSEMY